MQGLLACWAQLSLQTGFGWPQLQLVVQALAAACSLQAQLLPLACLVLLQELVLPACWGLQEPQELLLVLLLACLMLQEEQLQLVACLAL